MAGRTPLHVFRNVPVVPVTAVHRHVALGGPIWPDFAVQTAVRHWRGGLPVDAEPMAWPATNEVDQPAVWGGFLDKAFGHLVPNMKTQHFMPKRDRSSPRVQPVLDTARGAMTVG